MGSFGVEEDVLAVLLDALAARVGAQHGAQADASEATRFERSEEMVHLCFFFRRDALKEQLRKDQASSNAWP